MTHVVFDRNVTDGIPGEGAICCLACRATDEVDALASEAEGVALKLAFEEKHARCGGSMVAEVEA